jgi:hypothetical protein
VLCKAEGSKEATLSSGKEASFDVAIYDAEEGIEGGKKRRKQRPQGTAIVANHNGGDDEEAGESAFRPLTDFGD